MTELTKREQFAKAAMQALLTDLGSTKLDLKHVAKVSVEAADTLIAELERLKTENHVPYQPPKKNVCNDPLSLGSMEQYRVNTIPLTPSSSKKL